MRSPDPNRIRIGLRIGYADRTSETDSHERTNERTHVDKGADVNHETAVDAGARIKEFAFEGER